MDLKQTLLGVKDSKAWRLLADFGGLAASAASVLVIALLIIFGLHEVGHGMADISWPNCSRLPSIFFERAVIGASGGLDFHPNVCLGKEVRTTAVYGLYANTGDPGFPRIKMLGTGPLRCQDLNCYSFNYGYQAGLYVARQARLAAANSPEWWLDVETVNSWTNSIKANRADIRGMIAAISSQTFLRPQIGIYTAANQWVAIVGHWELKLPLWLGTGATSKAAAAKDCKAASPTGGKIVLTQYTLSKQDYNYICSTWAKPKYF